MVTQQKWSMKIPLYFSFEWCVKKLFREANKIFRLILTVAVCDKTIILHEPQLSQIIYICLSIKTLSNAVFCSVRGQSKTRLDDYLAQQSSTSLLLAQVTKRESLKKLSLENTVECYENSTLVVPSSMPKLDQCLKTTKYIILPKGVTKMVVYSIFNF